MGEPSQPFDAIIGEQLSAVVFVLDYWQLQFDGPTISALSRLEVCVDGVALRDEHDQFRNVICGQIGKIVTAVALIQREAFKITFKDQSSIRISLRSEDYRGPEAMIFHGHELTEPMIVRDDG